MMSSSVILPGLPVSRYIRSDSNMASSMSWVINRVDRWISSITFRYQSWTDFLVIMSSAEKGSSNSATLPENRYVRSRAALCLMPPESWAGYFF